MGFPRLDYWHGLSFPSPADLPNSGIEPGSPASTTLAGGCFTTESPGKLIYMYVCIYMKENPFKLERKSQIKKWNNVHRDTGPERRNTSDSEVYENDTV